MRRPHSPPAAPAPAASRAGAGIATVDVHGLEVHPVSAARALEAIAGWVQRQTPAFVCFANVHSVMNARRDRRVRRAMSRAALVLPDGMPVVWHCRRRGHAGAERVYGPDLLLRACEHGLGDGWRHFFFGGGPGVAERLAERLAARFAGLEVAGAVAPPFPPPPPGEDAPLLAAIARARPDLLWVGLGSSRQDLWMADRLGRVAAPVMLGVGAAFDFLSGAKPQAPPWLRRRGLEWLFRLASEPRRLGPRYLRDVPAFLALSAARALGL